MRVQPHRCQRPRADSKPCSDGTNICSYSVPRPCVCRRLLRRLGDQGDFDGLPTARRLSARGRLSGRGRARIRIRHGGHLCRHPCRRRSGTCIWAYHVLPWYIEVAFVAFPPPIRTTCYRRTATPWSSHLTYVSLKYPHDNFDLTATNSHPLCFDRDFFSRAGAGDCADPCRPLYKRSGSRCTGIRLTSTTWNPRASRSSRQTTSNRGMRLGFVSAA